MFKQRVHFFFLLYSNDSSNYGTFFRVVRTLFVHYVKLITLHTFPNKTEKNKQM